jgi:hypothetical protein
MGYAETLQRVAALDRIIVERTTGVPAGPQPAANEFSQILNAQLAQGQAVDALAMNGVPLGALSGGVTPDVVRSLMPPAGALPATALGAMYSTSAVAPGQPSAPSMLRGKVEGLEPELVAGLEKVARAIGKPLEIISGLRTRQEQEELYRRYLNGTGNLAAVPGTSRHESGRAADVYVDGVALANVEGAREAAASAGLGFPVPGEAWHVERV